jgi:hypothetical protein
MLTDVVNDTADAAATEVATETATPQAGNNKHVRFGDPQKGPPAKRSKHTDVADCSLLRRYMNQGCPVIEGRAKLIVWLSEDQDNMYKLSVATHVQERKDLQTLVLPSFPGVTYVRNKQHQITGVSCSEKNLPPKRVAQMLQVFGAQARGNATIIMNDDGRDCQGCMLIPTCEVVSFMFTRKQGNKDPPIEMGLGGNVIERTGYSHRVLRLQEVLNMVKIPTLKMADLPGLLRNLSELRKVDRESDISSLIDLTSVNIALKEGKWSKRYQQTFLNTLSAAFLGHASLEDKVMAFQERPEWDFFRKLHLNRPFTRPLIKEGKAVKKIKISDLADNDLVLLQPLVFDQKGYGDLSLHTEVFVFQSGLSIKRKRGTAKVTSGGTIQASLLQRIIVARGSLGARQEVKAAADVPSDSHSSDGGGGESDLEYDDVSV